MNIYEGTAEKNLLPRRSNDCYVIMNGSSTIMVIRIGLRIFYQDVTSGSFSLQKKENA